MVSLSLIGSSTSQKNSRNSHKPNIYSLESSHFLTLFSETRIHAGPEVKVPGADMVSARLISASGYYFLCTSIERGTGHVFTGR